MALVALTEGSYTGRSVLSGAQRQVNLYAEANPEGSDFEFTYLPTPGLRVLVQSDTTRPGRVRMLHTTSNGDLYAVIGATLYWVSPAWALTALFQLYSFTGPTYMTDNGNIAILVDGSPDSYQINLVTHVCAVVNDPASYGGSRVDVIDTYFVFAKPGTSQFYASPSLAVTPFNPLWFANKSTYPDNLQSLIVIHGNIWLIGAYSTEIWPDVGSSDFPFARAPGSFIDQGTCAAGSVVGAQASVFFLSQNAQGDSMVVRGQNYQVTRISTHALEAALSGYLTVADAVGMTYQMMGHTFYILTFPAADATWSYDLATDQWHQLVWTDGTGREHCHRANCMANAYDEVVCGDFANGTIYALDPTVGDDAGNPTKRVRTFQTLASDGRRQVFKAFIAEMEVGRASATAPPPMVSLSWSDDRGVSFGNPIEASVGQLGEFLTSVQFRRLGLGRNRVFQLQWSFPYFTALSGAFIDAEACAS